MQKMIETLFLLGNTKEIMKAMILAKLQNSNRIENCLKYSVKSGK